MVSPMVGDPLHDRALPSPRCEDRQEGTQEWTAVEIPMRKVPVQSDENTNATKEEENSSYGRSR